MLEKARETILTGLRSHWGAQAEVVRRTGKLKNGGFTKGYVFLVLTGERTNLEILNVAAEVLAERNNKKTSQLTSLNQKVAELQPA